MELGGLLFVFVWSTPLFCVICGKIWCDTLVCYFRWFGSLLFSLVCGCLVGLSLCMFAFWFDATLCGLSGLGFILWWLVILNYGFAIDVVVCRLHCGGYCV